MPLISLRFLFFLTVVLLAYYLCSKRQRWLILLCSSIVFYATYGLGSFIFIFFVSLSSYAFALAMRKCRKEGSDLALRAILRFSVAMIIGAWAVAKIRDMQVLGLSFYSLRVISYLIEVKRGKLEPLKDPFKYLLFVSFFPMALLGPVAKYDEMSESLYSGSGARGEDFLSGAIRLLWGVFKKTVIANMLAIPLAEIYSSLNEYSGAYVLFLLVFYSAEIYADFSGGIDMALGVSEMLGITLPENFNRPFSSCTLREFWNRWHITLGSWFERYVFYPLSLSKPMQKLSRLCRKRLGVNVGKKIPVYTATLVTWSLTGLWHGARLNFVAWGVINGVLVLVSQETAPIKERLCIPGFLNRIGVFLVIGAVRLLDVYKSLPLTAKMLGTVFLDFESYRTFFSGGLLKLFLSSQLIVLALSLALFFVVSACRVSARTVAKKPVFAAVCVFALALASITFGIYGKGFNAGEFIYSRF